MTHITKIEKEIFWFLYYSLKFVLKFEKPKIFKKLFIYFYSDDPVVPSQFKEKTSDELLHWHAQRLLSDDYDRIKCHIDGELCTHNKIELIWIAFAALFINSEKALHCKHIIFWMRSIYILYIIQYFEWDLYIQYILYIHTLHIYTQLKRHCRKHAVWKKSHYIIWCAYVCMHRDVSVNSNRHLLIF